MRHDPLRVDGTLRASFLLGIEHVEEATGCGCMVILIALVVMLAGALLRAGWAVMS